MPKTPKLRPHYRDDARFLLRLVHAIEQDPTRPLAWRTLVNSKLQELAHILLEPPDGEEIQTPEEGKTGDDQTQV